MRSDLWQTVKSSNLPIVLYGMGNGADAVIVRLKQDGIAISGVFASDEFVRGQYFHGLQVMKYSQIKEKFKKFIVLTAFGTSDSRVIHNIKNIAQEQELYIADVPVYGNTVFDSAYFKENEEFIYSITEKLTDERSKEVFGHIVDFKLTGKPDSLFAAEDSEDQVFDDIICLKEKDRIFDLGAYIGDTVKKFKSYQPEYGEIIAVEPDRKNFARLCSFCEGVRDVHCVNAAVGYLNGEVYFGSQGGRNQTVDCGETMVKSITIDSLAGKYGAPDFIKFDIEGQELNAIIGGEETIKKYKPKLLISAYHRSEDMVTIPRKVLKLRPDYKMYIRHFPCIPCWDTYYIFI